MWRRVVAGVVAAVAVIALIATLIMVMSGTEQQVAGIVVPQPEASELSVPQATVRAAAAESAATTSTPPPTTATTSTPPAVTTTKPKPPRTTSSAAPPPPAPPRFSPAGTFRIVNYVNFLVLDSGGPVEPGSPMKLWEPTSPSNNLRFQLLETGGGYYRLVNRTNGLTVDGRGATTEGSYVGQRPWDSSAAMQWLPTDTGNGLFTFTNRATGMLLDGGGPGVEYGARAKQWPASGSPNLLWRIETV